MIASVSTSNSNTGTNTTTHILSARVRKTIQSIKEIVGNFSDADIYLALKETNMDPNEAAQKLLNQDPFHEVKRKRDKKKENMDFRGSADSRKNSENVGQGTKLHIQSGRNNRQKSYPRTAVPGAGVNREFRVVRDNRVNINTARETKSALQPGSASSNVQAVATVTEKGSSGNSGNVKHSGLRSSSQASNGPADSQSRHTRDTSSNFTDRKVILEEKQAVVSCATSRMQVIKPNSQHYSATQASSNSVVGVYSSSMDPVHVPSPESRSSAAVGAIKREVGVVGGRRQSSENAVKSSSASSSSFSNLVLGRDGSFSESFRSFATISKTDQGNQPVASESAVPSISASRSLLANHYSRPHQTVAGHQKAAQHNKEWKPKSSQKSSVDNPGVIGTPTKSSPPADNSEELESDAANLQDKLLQLNIYKNENVIIAQHIRAPESDVCRLTFGSFGVEFNSSRNMPSGFQASGVTEDLKEESATSLSASAPDSSSEDASGSKQIELADEHVRNSASNSSASGAMSEHQSPDKPSSPPNLDNYANIGLVRDNSPFTPSESQHQQDPHGLPSFSAYDPQTGYDISYFRPQIEETVRGQGLPSAQEALTSHTINNMPTSSTPMAQQQQQPPLAQMYPQVHVSHFTNLMPYRQFLSPVYVPQMAMPGYSSNPAYPHPSNGSSYLLMPGGSSHLSANGLKYGIQQFKQFPGSNPTGFGNFTSPTGYAINAPGVVGSVTGLEDSSRMKYKDGNLYVPNPQAETSEIWVQNPRELPNLQSAPYYNLPGQSPHAAYLPSHTGHASFNAAAAQSSHMQFPGLYPPPPPTPAPLANPHHLGPVMGGNVGVGVAPAAAPGLPQMHQQPQLGHLNWTTNF